MVISSTCSLSKPYLDCCLRLRPGSATTPVKAKNQCYFCWLLLSHGRGFKPIRQGVALPTGCQHQALEQAKLTPCLISQFSVEGVEKPSKCSRIEDERHFDNFLR
jgi:hypothetical protein